MRKIFYILIVVSLLIAPSYATIINVPADQPTIQSGIAAAVSGDTIYVSEGIYQEHINFLGKSILVEREFSTDSTIIEKYSDNTPIVTFSSGEDTLSILRGFTIREATESGILITNSSPIIEQCIIEYNSKGGIMVNQESSKPIIRDNIIRFNTRTDGYGGGILLYYADAEINSNIIQGNTSNGGPGIEVFRSSANISRNVIHNNVSTNSEATILILEATSTSFTNNTVVKNTVPSQGVGGISIGGSTNTEILNNIIAFNTSYGIYAFSSTDLDFRYCCVFGNQNGEYYNIGPGIGCFELDPMFIDTTVDYFHLLPSSPCIDGGNPSTPLDPDGSRADIGAYYYDGQSWFYSFSLIQPADKAVKIDAIPVFTWHGTVTIDSGYTANYNIIMDDNPQFESPDTSELIYDTLYIYPDSLIRSDRYYWKVLASNDYSQPRLSNQSWEFYLDGYPTMPTIISPINGSTINDDSYLSWLAATDPDDFDTVFYLIQIDDNSDFSSPEIVQARISDHSLLVDEAFAIRLGDLIDIDNLDWNTTYYWRIKSQDAFGLHSTFTADECYFFYGDAQTGPNNAPYPPLGGYSPSDDSEVTTETPRITWDHALDADTEDDSTTLRYTIQLDFDGEFDEDYAFEYDTPEGINFVTVSHLLTEDNRWYYRIRTTDNGGLSSPWSLVQTFWVNHDNQSPFAPPGEMYPSGGQLVNSSWPEIHWNHASDPDPSDDPSVLSYLIQIDSDGEFDDDPAFQYTTPAGINNHMVTDSLTDDIWYYRISTLDDFAAQSSWTEIQTFEVNTSNLPPDAPVSGFSPADYEEVISLTPTITWNSATDPDPDDHADNLHYIFHLFSDTSTGCDFEYWFTTNDGINQVTVADSMPDNCLWIYLVKSVDDGGLESEWSEMQHFWTNHYNYPPEPFALNIPEPDIKWVDYYTHFSWGKSLDDDPLAEIEYTLQVSPDSLFSLFVLTREGLTDTFRTMITDTLALAGGNLYWRVFAEDDDSLIRFGGLPRPEVRKLNIFPAGDANTDGLVVGSDVTFLVNYFRGVGAPPDPVYAGDANADCALHGADVSYLVNYFRGLNPTPNRENCQIIEFSGKAGGNGK